MYTPSADGGHARYAWELMSAMVRHPRGITHRFELVTSADVEPQFRSDAYTVNAILPPIRARRTFRTRLGWVANRVAHYPRRDLRFLRWLARRPDIAAVHMQEWTPWLAAFLFDRMRRMGKKVYYTVHNVVPHKYPLGVPKAIMHLWIRRACRRCDGLFVHTDALAEQLSRFLAGHHPPIRVMPHGVWTVAVPDAAPPIGERLEWKRLLFFGSIRRNKGLHALLKAAEDLEDYTITIAGQPLEQNYFDTEILPQVRKLRAMGRRIDLIDRFVADEEVGPLFASHSAIVMPYTQEFAAQSGVIFMALAHELPVVATEAGGLRDLLADHRIGVSCRGDTPADLADAVRSLHEQGARGDLCGQMRAAKRRHSWHAAAGITLAGYADAGVPTTEADDRLVETTVAH